MHKVEHTKFFNLIANFNLCEIIMTKSHAKRNTLYEKIKKEKKFMQSLIFKYFPHVAQIQSLLSNCLA